MESQQQDVKKANASIGELQKQLFALRFGPAADAAIVFCFSVNFLTLFMRPQDLPGLGFLGSIRFPMLIAIATGLAVAAKISKPWPTQLKIFMGFMGVEAFRGVVGYFADPNNTIVVNDFWHFQTWKDLGLQLISVILPVQLVLTSSKRMTSIYNLCMYCALLLGVWSVTHSGVGPGGFLGDENDNCLVLVMLLPFVFLSRLNSRSGAVRTLALFAAIFCLGGAVATNSRGGFLGLIAVLGSFFWASKRKVVWVGSALLLGLAILPFVPKDYWQEVVSIKTETQGRKGTIEERLDTWAIVWNMFKDPRNMPAGVGLNNSPWNLGDYQPVSRGRVEKSLAGRSVHSTYFQLLGDLGLWGFGIVGAIVWVSIRQLRAIEKSSKRHLRQLSARIKGVREEVARTASQREEDEQLLMGLQRLEREARFQFISAPLVVCSWLGVLAAAIGVSVLYYPPIWFLASLSAAHYTHWQRFVRAHANAENLIRDRFPEMTNVSTSQ